MAYRISEVKLKNGLKLSVGEQTTLRVGNSVVVIKNTFSPVGKAVYIKKT
jgi:hypothetical protein